jgi:FeS assembly SUF system protein
MDHPASGAANSEGAKEVASAPLAGASSPATADEGKVWAMLRNCYDPEIPLNIVDLGLVYDVAVKGDQVQIRMTLTAPGCPMAGQMAEDVQNKVLTIEGVEEVKVELVWEPPWNQGMMSEAGKLELGLM